jgi:hypothetical protein
MTRSSKFLSALLLLLAVLWQPQTAQARQWELRHSAERTPSFVLELHDGSSAVLPERLAEAHPRFAQILSFHQPASLQRHFAPARALQRRFGREFPAWLGRGSLPLRC